MLAHRIAALAFVFAASFALQARAEDDPLICGAAAAEWRDTNKGSRESVNQFQARIPAECGDLNRAAAAALAQLGPPPPAPPPSFTGPTYTVELEGCTRLSQGAECTTWVSPRSRIAWHFNNRSYLADANGGAIPATWMSIGSSPMSIQGRVSNGAFIYLEANIRTRITYRFSGNVTPSEVQALIIAVGAPLSRRSASLRPIPWN